VYRYVEEPFLARTQPDAWAAYRRGYELQGLKNKLKAAGKWSDPP